MSGSSSSSSAAASSSTTGLTGPAHLASGPVEAEVELASNPLGILALVEEASRGLGPKLLAGGLSCMLLSFALNPMDVIKVRLQMQAGAAAAGSKIPKYDGFSHAFRTIYREEGYRRGLMRGVTASLMRDGLYSSVRMGAYDLVKVLLAPPSTSKDEFTLGQKILAGCISGAVGSILASPTDLVKIRFQSYTLANPNPYPHTFGAFGSIYREGGVRALWQGASPTVVRAAILTGSQLSSYDHSKRMMLQSGAFQDNPTTHLCASVISGLVTTTATSPADVIKTRCMNDAGRVLYRNPIDCVIKTARHEGVRAFFKGWLPNYLRLGPLTLFSLPIAEFIRVSLGTDSF